VAHSRVGDEFRAGDACGRVPSALRLDQRVVLPGDDQRGRDDPRDRGNLLRAPGGELAHRPAGHLFGSNVTRVAFRRGAYLRGYVLTFAELLSDRLTRPLLLRALGGAGENYDL